jgi:hypothetical protein
MGTIEHQGKAPSTDGTGQRPHTTPKPDKSVNRYLAEANTDPKLFVWTAEPDGIIEKVRPGYQASQSLH